MLWKIEDSLLEALVLYTTKLWKNVYDLKKFPLHLWWIIQDSKKIAVDALGR